MFVRAREEDGRTGRTGRGLEGERGRGGEEARERARERERESNCLYEELTRLAETRLAQDILTYIKLC